jgi:hypothetical protein
MGIINPGQPTNLGADWRAAGSGSRDPAEMRNRILRSEGAPPPPPPELGTITNLAAAPGDGVAWLTWTPAANATSHQPQYRATGSGTWLNSGSAIGGSANSATVAGLTNGTAYEFRVVASDGTNNTASNTATATPAVVSGHNQHEPAGMTFITENVGSAKPADWWMHNPNGHLSYVNEVGPVSNHSLRYRFPQGHPGGSGVGTTGRGSGNAGSASNIRINDQPVKEVYLRYYVKYSVGWQNPDNMAKMGYTYQMNADGSRRGLLHFDTVGYRVQSQYTTKVTRENATGGIDNLNPNGATKYLTPGQWSRFEVYATAATTDSSNDGIVRWWVDGDLVGNYTNVPRPSRPFTELHWNPVWGGGSTINVQSEQYVWFNGIYLSGKA